MVMVVERLSLVEVPEHGEGVEVPEHGEGRGGGEGEAERPIAAFK